MSTGLGEIRIKHADVLTSADKELILINSNEYHYSDGEVVFRMDEENVDGSVYWISKGYLKMEDQYGTIATLGPSSLIKSRKGSPQGVAYGELVVRLLDHDYIKALIARDDILALRFFRRIATSSLVTLRSMLENADFIEGLTPELPKKVSILTCSKGTQIVHSKPTGRAFRCMMGDQHVTCQVKNTKIKLSFNTLGLKKKIRLRYSDITGVSRSSDVSITILTKDRKGRTLFFDDSTAASAFIDLSTTILTRTSSPSVVMRPHAPLSPRTSFTSSSSSVSNLDSSDIEASHSEDSKSLSDLTSYDILEEEEDKAIMKSISELKTYHRGDRIVSEGDLYQRIYQIEKGNVELIKNGVSRGFIAEGESFGDVTVVQLRPYEISLIAASDVVEVRVVTGNKLFQIIENNPRFGVRMYRDITNYILKKIIKISAARIEKKRALSTTTNDYSQTSPK